jgi:hypothetical protein
MEVSGQHHAPAVLPRVKTPRYLLNKMLVFMRKYYIVKRIELDAVTSHVFTTPEYEDVVNKRKYFHAGRIDLIILMDLHVFSRAKYETRISGKN